MVPEQGYTEGPMDSIESRKRPMGTWTQYMTKKAAEYLRKDALLNKWCQVNRIVIKEKNINLYPYFTPCRKANSRWLLDLNVKGKTIKFSEDNIGEYLHGLEVVKGFLNRIQKY